MATLVVSSAENSTLGDEQEFLNAVKSVDTKARIHRPSVNEVLVTCQNELGLRMLRVIEGRPFVEHAYLESNSEAPFTDRTIGLSGDRQEAQKRRATVEISSVTFLTL